MVKGMVIIFWRTSFAPMIHSYFFSLSCPVNESEARLMSYQFKWVSQLHISKIVSVNAPYDVVNQLLLTHSGLMLFLTLRVSSIHLTSCTQP